MRHGLIVAAFARALLAVSAWALVAAPVRILPPASALALLAVAERARAARTVTILPQGQVLRGRFVQERHLRGFDAPLRSEGSFVLMPGQGLIWRVETPFAITTVITVAGLVQDIDGAETLRLPATRLPFLPRLYSMLSGALSGDWQTVEPDFTIARSGSDARWQVDLTPRRPDAIGLPLRGIAVTGSRFVDRVRIDRPDGDFEQLMFLDQTLSPAPLGAEEAAALASIGR